MQIEQQRMIKTFRNSSINTQRQKEDRGPYCCIVMLSSNQTAMLHDT
jgi:hypothetical protein